MVALRHPLSGTLYEQIIDPPGAVRVVGKDGAEGIFDDSARYLSGERRTADIGMCRWVSNGISTADRVAMMADPRKASQRGESGVQP
jgi:hypothetical protein